MLNNNKVSQKTVNSETKLLKNQWPVSFSNKYKTAQKSIDVELLCTSFLSFLSFFFFSFCG